MKYARLTKEQFDELHAEFASFLATQAIDKAEWDSLKINKHPLFFNIYCCKNGFILMRNQLRVSLLPALLCSTQTPSDVSQE